VDLLDSKAEEGDHHSDRALLLVDDEASIRELLTMVLESSGYRCLPALSGLQALALFRDRHLEIEAIVTDVNMADLDGYSLVRAVREIVPEIKIVLSSGSLGEAEHRIAADLRVAAFLPKPYTVPQLISCIRGVFPQG
jgi:CheY-like chemotaxis protein